MTTIAWDGKTLAADRAIVSRGVYTPTTKLVHCQEPTNTWPPGVFAGAGDLSFLTALEGWINRGEPLPAAPESTWEEQCGLYVTYRNTRCHLITKRGGRYLSEAPFEADGTGFEFALACMICGKTAIEAVQLAIQHTSHAALGFDSWTFK